MRRGGNLSARWIFCAGFALAFVICLTPIANPDLWWHLSSGRWIVSNGMVPRTDFLSWSKEGQPWIDFEWGAQVVCYGLYRLGGAAALWSFKVAVFTGILLLFAALLRLWRLPDTWIAMGLPVFALAMVPSLDFRPEIASFFFSLAQLYILERRRLGALRLKPRPLLLLHVGLYALWANLHAGYPVGLGLCLIYGAGEAFEGGQAGPWLAMAAAGVLGSLCNPYGPKIVLVIFEHWRQMSLLKGQIIEWGPPHLYNPYQRTYWILFLLTCCVFLDDLRGRRRAPAAHYLAVILLAVFSSRSLRNTIYFSLIAFPVGLRAAFGLSSPPWWPRLRPYALACLFAALGATGISVLGQSKLFERIDDTKRYQPVGACDFLARQKSLLAGLRLYNSWNFGSYAGYTLYPDYKVFMDGRYIFTEYLQEAFEQAMTSPQAWQVFLANRKIDLVFMEPSEIGLQNPATGSKSWRPLDVYFMPSSEWALVYWDSAAMIWVRRAKVPQEWLKAHEFRFLRPRDLQFLSIAVVSGGYPLQEVLSEIWRYVREVRDVGQSELLIRWVRENRR